MDINKIEGVGTFYVDVDGAINNDYMYPCVDVEFVPVNEKVKEGIQSRPRILFEYDEEEHELRALIWNDPDSEDASDDIIFDLNKYMHK